MCADRAGSDHRIRPLGAPSARRAIDPDIETFLSEASSFPASPNDDEVDAMTQYVNWRRKRSKTGGLADWMRAQAEELAASRGTANG